MTSPCEAALAEILLAVDGRGDGETLDGRDPGMVVALVKKKLGIREASRARAKSSPKKRPSVRRVSPKQAARKQARRDAVVPPPDQRVAEVGADCPEFREYITRLVCCVDLRPTHESVDPAHLRTKRNAGDWVAGPNGEPVGNIFPARHALHMEQHGINGGIKTFAKKYDRDLYEVCRVVGEGYMAGLDPATLSAMAIRAGGYERVVFGDDTSQLSEWSAAFLEA